jgi:hypothetical protein
MTGDDDRRNNEPQIGRVTRIVCLLLVVAFLVWTFVSIRFEGDDASGSGPAAPGSSAHCHVSFSKDHIAGAVGFPRGGRQTATFTSQRRG